MNGDLPDAIAGRKNPTMNSTQSTGQPSSDDWDRPARKFPKMLVVSWSLPPALVGSSQIINSLARQFNREEMILAGELWPGLESNRWNDEKGKKPSINFIHKQWPWRFKKTFRLFILPVVWWRLSLLIRRTHPQQIFAIYPSEYYLFLGWLAAKWFRLPLTTYFHNTYLENRRGIKRYFANWLQPRVFRDSLRVFVMSEGMRSVLQPKYPEVIFLPLIHTYETPVSHLTREPEVKEPLNIAFMGSLNDSNREAFSRIPAVLAAFPTCQFTTYSGNRDADFSAIGVSGLNVRHKRVAFDEVVQALRQHDVLFFPHGFTGGLKPIEYQTIFPTRTIPYLLSGIPIVAHSPPDAYLTKWLKEKNCAEVVEVPEADALVDAFRRLLASPGRCRILSENAQQAGTEYFAPIVAGNFRKQIFEALQN